MLFKSILLSLAQLINNKKYSDLKLVYQGLEFKIYKVIICI
jgi:hypothetical protein